MYLVDDVEGVLWGVFEKHGHQRAVIQHLLHAPHHAQRYFRSTEIKMRGDERGERDCREGGR